MKTCPKCLQETDQFYRNRKRPDGLQHWCKRCVKEAQARLNYGLSLEAIEAMARAQDNKCSICFSAFKSAQEIQVDHDHTTGAVRGLLCVDCNLGLGRFKDNPQYLQRAIVYLEWYKQLYRAA